MREVTTICILLVGIWLILSIQLNCAPYTVRYDRVAGRMVKVYPPGNRPVLAVLEDALRTLEADTMGGV